MKYVPSHAKYTANPTFWDKEALKPDSKRIEILLIVSCALGSSVAFFIIPVVIPEYEWLCIIIGWMLAIFTAIVLLTLIFEKKWVMHRNKKEFRNLHQIITDSKGEKIIVEK
ncbi:MAG: hypothetical protein V4665_01195 [Patescibacteria group bacterium]